MANMIIKPAADGNLLIQDRAGGAVLSTTASGATVANATLTAPTVADMSNCTFPSGHVMYTQRETLGGGNQETSSTSFTTTGLEITVPAAKVALGSKIVISISHSCAIDQGSARTRFDYQIWRTAPSTSEIMVKYYVGIDQQMTRLIVPMGDTCVDNSLGTGNHHYQLRVKRLNGDECSSIFYKWYTNSVHVITAMVVK